MNSAERDHLLLITPQLPWPAHQGSTLRNLNILRGLAERYAVTLLAYTTDANAEFGPLIDLCHEIVTVIEPQRSTATRLWQMASMRLPDMAHRLNTLALDLMIDELLTETDFKLVQIEGIELARTIDLVREISPQSKIVFDCHNAEAELQRNALEADKGNPSRLIAAAYSAVQVQRLTTFERWALESADAATAVSEEDAALLRALAPSASITVIPNCIDVQDYAEIEAEPIAFDLMFMGKMDYRPNIDAMLWFVDEIWPQIRAKRPDTTLAIVGQKPHARLDRIRDVAGITLTGWVDSVLPYVAGAGVVIMPLRVGSGTRLKVAQSFAAAKAVVSTALGVAGYPAVHGEHLLIADDSAEFAAATLQLLDNPEQAAQLGQAARAFANDYDWRSVIPAFFDVYAQILE